MGDVTRPVWVAFFDASYGSKLAPSASKSMVSRPSKPSSLAKARALHSSGATVTESI